MGPITVYLLLCVIKTALGQTPGPQGSPIYYPYPYYGYGYFCPGSQPGFLNDTCDDEHPCYNDYSLECQNGTCLCRKGFIPSSQNNGLCDYAPGLNQYCETECQIPLVCRGPYDSTTVDPVDENGTVSSSSQSYEYSGKKCYCDQPYILRYGYDCYLECPPDQYYDREDGKCKPKCHANEVKLEDGSCAPAAHVGEPCYDDIQCVEEYSVCINGSCGCLPGFVVKNGDCVDEKYACPWGEPDKDANGDVVPCNRTAYYQPYYHYHDTCFPYSSFCLTSPSYIYYPEYVETGFCCPEPNISCPAGEALPDTDCGTEVHHADEHTNTRPKPCPYQTHYCYSVNVNYGYSASLCCPKACQDNKDGSVLVDGICYQYVQYGDECVVDEQCSRFNGICINGTCGCAPNAQIYGYDQYKYCYVVCAPDEIQYGNKCYQRLKLNDTCSQDAPVNLCPYNAGCDEENKCSCYCDYIPIGDSRCEPYPVCRRNYYYYYYYDYPTSVESSTPAGEVNDTGSVKCSHEKKTTTAIPETTTAVAQSDEDYTFCIAYGQQPPVPAVENCPEGQYCNYYLYDLGLCCPIPKPICPDGSGGAVSCDPSSSVCGPGYYCYTYYHAVGGYPKSASVCCQNYYYYYR